ncbi:hypothetical protein MUK42_15734, partial [Musa troglodytarum]
VASRSIRFPSREEGVLHDDGRTQRARDLTGSTEICLEMPDGSTARDCMCKLLIEFPNLREIYNSMVLALNEEYAPESTLLKDKDELAIIPPISGG